MARLLFFYGVVKPFVFAVLGLKVQREHLLPRAGPAILVANHNSHLDTFVLLSLFPYRLAKKIRPIANPEYFLKNRVLAWFVLNIVGIIPANRAMLDGVHAALAAGEIVLLFPEGTRGEPEHLAPFQCGIAHIAKSHPEVPITPVFIRGTGMALPRGDPILVPFLCDAQVAEPLLWSGDKAQFMGKLERRFHELGCRR
jgi:1-acyl-sn-glycerol-3-phosphate acyltransferase